MKCGMTISCEISNGTLLTEKINFREIGLNSLLGGAAVLDTIKIFEKIERKSE